MKISGNQNHLKSPFKNLYTLGKVNPFSLTLSGIVINLSSTRVPTNITMNETAKAVTHT